ncbi:protein of unknown function DUF4326 [Klosneuvirus KNV1]|uniref:DUF4326 domain-containing protein n=1 Tax=Klosneuvirus KNV1 TaxID=1977640 RepID=A0A1V0SL09_9VIRU|nr:protein of unknown function DUF4326 [Klosneuvirus KNV1]
MSVVNVKKKYLNQAGYKDFEDWSKDPNHVYIGRDMSFYVKGTKGSKWQNPFPVKKYGLDKCAELYKEYMTNNKDLLDQLDELDGKVLGCWCKPDKCHGDILLELLKQKNKPLKN